MITITTTQTFQVSEENAPFIELIIQKAGWYRSDEETMDEAISRIVQPPIHSITRNIVVPTLYEYFGIAWKESADQLVQAIDGWALETVTSVTHE